MRLRLIGLALAALLVGGCYNWGMQGGGGGASESQTALSDDEPTDDNGTDENGTHHHPRKHVRTNPSASTNPHQSGVTGAGTTSTGTP